VDYGWFFEPSLDLLFARILVPADATYQSCGHKANCNDNRYAHNQKIIRSNQRNWRAFLNLLTKWLIRVLR
jgi:hypothetical protein